MKLSFVKAAPTGNMTILVTSPVARAAQPGVGAALMDYESVHAEQAGFVEQARHPGAWARLQMAGGEFCGNAAMSLAAYLARARGISEGAVPIEVSGAPDLILCRVRAAGGAYLCAVDMPRPASLSQLGGVPVLRLPGIAHAIVEGAAEDAPALAQWIADETGEDAVGVMEFSRAEGKIRPFVYVRSAGTMVWERGCGSGTAAVGAYLALAEGRDVDLPLTQPGGVIRVRAACRVGVVTALEIEGRVRIVAEGVAHI